MDNDDPDNNNNDDNDNDNTEDNLIARRRWTCDACGCHTNIVRVDRNCTICGTSSSSMGGGGGGGGGGSYHYGKFWLFVGRV
jgi:hypothetical protein